MVVAEARAGGFGRPAREGGTAVGFCVCGVDDVRVVGGEAEEEVGRGRMRIRRSSSDAWIKELWEVSSRHFSASWLNLTSMSFMK